MKNLKGMRILITGAASGLGRGLALRCARDIVTLVLWDINETGLASVKAEAEKLGSTVHTMICDMSDKAAIAKNSASVSGLIGGVDILINNAGIVSGKTLLECSDKEIEKTIAINETALFWTTRAFLPGMIERNRGHVVTVSSAAGVVGVPKLTDYCVSKFAAFGFDESLRIEMKRLGKNIRTTVICPFFINTGMFDGVKTRFPLLLPILKPDRVVARMYTAIRKQKARLLMPWLVYTTWFVRLFPVGFFDAVAKFLGISSSMDEFKGRVTMTHEKPVTTAEEVKTAVEKAKKVQKDWATTTIRRRAKSILKIRDYLVNNADTIAGVISDDNGKMMLDALAAEVMPAAMSTSYYAKNAARFLKPRRQGGGNLLLFNKDPVVHRKPYGVVGIISPWNYPFAIPFAEVIMALMAGNAVVLKTATETTEAGRAVAKAIDAAGLPDGLFTWVTMPGKSAGDAFIAAPVDKLFFTGSVPVGKELMKKCADTLIPLVLELGGNDAAIVLKDADIRRTVWGIMWAGFQNDGQSCGGAQRILVYRAIYDRFCMEMKKAIDSFRVGDGRSDAADMGRMTSKRQKETVERQVAECLKMGAKMFAQSPAPNEGLFLPAMMLTEVTEVMPVMKEEIFGPVIAVVPFDSIDEAVALANRSRLGLTSSVWSRSRSRAREVGLRIEAGAVMVNDHLMSHGIANSPWGGFKESGIGRTHGHLGFDEMTVPQVIVDDWLPGVKKNIWWHPYSKKVYSGLRGGLDFLYAKKLSRKLAGLGKLIGIFFRYFTGR